MEIVSTKNAPGAIGPYSQAMILNGVVYTSGQVALSPKTGEVVGTTIEEQAEQVMKNLGAVLEAAGSSYEKTVKTTCFLADMNDLQLLMKYTESISPKAGKILCGCKNSAEKCALRSRSHCVSRIR